MSNHKKATGRIVPFDDWSEEEKAALLKELGADDTHLPQVVSQAHLPAIVPADSLTPDELVNQAEAAERTQQALEIVRTLPPTAPEQYGTAADAAAQRFLRIDPRDTVEQMLATQMIALHTASLDCVQRAMLPDQPGDIRREELNLATKASRAFAQLAETFDRRRRGGSQKMTVEHVHVHAGGQAIVGNVETGGFKNVGK